MSQENVEVVRRLLEAVNRRDWDAMLETGDPEIEIVTLMSGTYRGHAGWRRLFEQMAEEVSGFQFVPEDLIDVGQDRVVAVTRWVGTGRTSGVALRCLRPLGSSTHFETAWLFARSPSETEPSGLLPASVDSSGREF